MSVNVVVTKANSIVNEKVERWDWRRQRNMMFRHRHTVPSGMLRSVGGIYDGQVSVMIDMLRIIWIGLMVILTFDVNPTMKSTMAQEISLTINDDVCGCSASTYAFVLDFSLSCPPTNITRGSGVASVSCLISPFGAPTNDVTPIAIDSVSVLELDQLNNVLAERRIDGGFVNGDEFSYSSVINNPEEVTTIQNIPKALQLNLSGRNKDGVMLLSVFVISFTNECGVTPVIQTGDSAGWVVFSQMDGPIPRFCPTRAPTSTPTGAPTTNPSQQPTKQPSQRPTQIPTQKPTDKPTSEPSESPTNEPTKRPSVPPTQKPTNKQTPQTTRRPTGKPSGSQTPSPTKVRTTPPISFDFPSIFDDAMSMPPMTYSNSWNWDYRQLMEGDIELIKEFLDDQSE